MNVTHASLIRDAAFTNCLMKSLLNLRHLSTPDFSGVVKRERATRRVIRRTTIVHGGRRRTISRRERVRGDYIPVPSFIDPRYTWNFLISVNLLRRTVRARAISLPPLYAPLRPGSLNHNSRACEEPRVSPTVRAALLRKIAYRAP